jgi:cell volume regulation protein A
MAGILRRPPVPLAALLLVAAALVSDVFPRLELSIHAVERIATAALVVILFDGGASIGLRRFRAAVVPIAWLGLPGTFATAGIMTLFLHFVLGLHWLTAGLLGSAIAPTDPAVMFSVLGNREIEGRTDTVLEGESGANDPVGIALMLGLIELATHADASFWVVVRVFAEQMAIGLAIGVAGGLLESRLLPRVARFSFVMTLALAAIVFLAADWANGSGFLAVFVAGLIRGDVEAPQQAQLERLRERLASVAEVVVFVALGLTVHLSGIGLGRWGQGLLVALFLVIVARPLVCGVLLAPVRLRAAEKLFVAWGGLKGAVPILLAAYTLTSHVHHAQRIYETVFVVVLASVVVQGGSIPFAARRLGVETAGATPRVEPSASGP